MRTVRQPTVVMIRQIAMTQTIRLEGESKRLIGRKRKGEWLADVVV